MVRNVGMLCVILFLLTGCSSSEDGSINLYTSRDYEVDKQIIENFTAETNIEVNAVELDNDELVTKAIAEKDTPMSDVVIVNGAQYYDELDESGVLQPINTSGLEGTVNSDFVGEKAVGLTYRARAICTAKDFDASNINSYEDLADPSLKGEILVRSSTNGYNQALIMNMIQEYGYDTTLEFAKGLVSNMAQAPEGGDRDQIKGVYSGVGSIALTNSYYYVQLLNSVNEAEVAAANSCDLKFLDDTHINTSWIGITSKGSENPSVSEFVNYFTSKDVQSLFASENGEFPVNDAADFGYFEDSRDFGKMDVDFEKLGDFKTDAQKIFNESGWE